MHVNFVPPELWTFPYAGQIAGPNGVHFTEVPTAMATQYSEGAHLHMQCSVKLCRLHTHAWYHSCAQVP